MGMIDIETDPQTINGFTEVCALPLLVLHHAIAVSILLP